MNMSYELEYFYTTRTQCRASCTTRYYVRLLTLFAAEGNYMCPWYSAGSNYSHPHSLADVGDYRHHIYAIYVGGT